MVTDIVTVVVTVMVTDIVAVTDTVTVMVTVTGYSLRCTIYGLWFMAYDHGYGYTQT